MQYDKAVNTLLDVNTVTGFLMFVIAALVLFILAGQAVKMWKDLFGKPKQDDERAYKQHCRDSEERFQRGEKHIAENHDHIMDLREGQRVMCVACIALLNHELHNGNSDEMNQALSGLNNYLINRK